MILCLTVHPGWHINLRNRVEHLLENGWSFNLRNNRRKYYGDISVHSVNFFCTEDMR